MSPCGHSTFCQTCDDRCFAPENRKFASCRARIDVIGIYQGRIHGLKSGGRIMASARNEAPKGVVWGGDVGRG